ncbi:related to Similarity to Mpa43p [Zygosaccharomyces bailii ISA1307]|nr:related to Similarity to Mpa43p [Zygosaccharomyces bailii ISA1307]
MHRGRSRSSMSISQQRLFSQSMLGASLEQRMIYYVGVDVGTGSARACLIDSMGNILSLSEKPIQREELKPGYITQSSKEIWNHICYCVKSVVRDSGVDVDRIHGIGFDATCSLVAVQQGSGEDVGVGPKFENTDQNVILWMDHRAVEETLEINATGDKVLQYVGGQMSIEMEIPKIKWLKNNMPREDFDKCVFYDLADYLTFKATGRGTRSFNSTVCKQGLLPIGVEGSTKGWSESFLNEIGLPELVANDFEKLGGSVHPKDENGRSNFLSAGEYVGALSPEAAADLGLTDHCVVGSGVIDAYAGWVGTVAAQTDEEIPELTQCEKEKTGIDKATGRLAAVAGTSTCHVALAKDPIFVPGVWGPYRDVMAPGFWCAEGGQSCTGALLAHVLSTHPAYTELEHLSESTTFSKFDYLNSRLESLVQTRNERSVVALAKHLFFYGDYHGNRSPIADPNMRAAIIGQSMDNSVDDLAITYLGACEFIAQQTRQIVETMCKAGHHISSVYMSGGQCRNGLLMRLLADCTGLPIVIPRYIDAAVVFGSALLGAVASESFNAHHAQTDLKKRRASSLGSKEQIMASIGKGGLNRLTNLAADQPSPYTAPHATASTSNGSYFPVVGPDPPSPKAIPEDAGEHGTDEEDPVSFKSVKSTAQAGLAEKTQSNTRANSASSGNGEELWKVMYDMTGGGKVVQPNPESHPDRVLLNAKYKIFLDMANTQRQYRAAIDRVETNLKASAGQK